MHRVTFSPHPHQHLQFHIFLTIAILTGVRWYSSLWFWFEFPWQLMMLRIFLCACLASVCLLGKIFRSSAHFLTFFEILNCVSTLYILDINPLSDVSFTGIFFYSVGCLFTLLIISFTVQKFSSLLRFHLFIFAFVSLVWGGRSKKYC